MKDSEEIKTIVNRYKWDSIQHKNIIRWDLHRIRYVDDYRFDIEIEGYQYKWEVHIIVDHKKQYDIVCKLHDEGRDIEEMIDKAEKFLAEKGTELLGEPLSLESRDTPISPLEKIRWHSYSIDKYADEEPYMEFDCTWEESASISIHWEYESWIVREWYRGSITVTSFQDEELASIFMRNRLDFTMNKELQRAMTF